MGGAVRDRREKPMIDKSGVQRTDIRVSPDGAQSAPAGAGQDVPALKPFEVRLIANIREDWALEFGSREVRLVIEYQNGVPVLIRATGERVKEEKLK